MAEFDSSRSEFAASRTEGGAHAPVATNLELVTMRVDGLSASPSQPCDTQPTNNATASTPPVGLHTPDGRYQCLAELARGGMGVVFRGYDRELRRELAVKVLLDRRLDNTDAVRRFHDEAWITGQLQHPGIVPIYDIGRLAGGEPYFIMKLVEGRTLANLLARRTHPEEERPRLLAIFEQVCQAVAYAHSRGVIHRDLKPANIMVGPFGEVQVMDWGLARVLTDDPAATQDRHHTRPRAQPPVLPPGPGLTGSWNGEVIGTPAYMAPEQARGELLDERCDVFGLGGILCEILTGQPPYPQLLPSEAFRHALNGEQVELGNRLEQCDADPDLILLARACLSPTQEKRPRDAGEVADHVTAYLLGVDERVREAELARATAQARAVEERKRQRLMFALAVSTFGLVVFGGSVAIWGAHQQLHEANLRAAVVQDKVRRDAETRRRVQQALDEARALREQARNSKEQLLLKWTQAQEAARRARELLPDQFDDADLVEQATHLIAELESQVQMARQEDADRHMLARIEEIRLQQTEVKDGRFDMGRADPAYREAFREYGFDLVRVDVTEAARAIRARPIVAELTAALVDWADLRTNLRGHNDMTAARLLAIARNADPDPQRVTAFDALAHRDLAKLRALAAQEDLTALPPSLLLLICLQLNEGTEAPLALEVLRKGVRQYPTDFWLNHQLGMKLYETQRHPSDEAIRALAAAVTLRPQSPGARMNLGLVLFQKGSWAPAIMEYREAIRLKPDYVEAHGNLAAALLKVGQKDEALRVLNQAIGMNPVVPLLQETLAEVLMADDKLDEAIQAYRQALKYRPNRAATYHDLGYALGQRRDWKEAEIAYRRSAELNPNYFLTHYNLGNMLTQLGKFEESIVSYRRAIELKSDYAEAHCNLGHSLRILRRYEEALAAMKRGHELGRTQPNWRYSSEQWLQEISILVDMNSRLEAVRRGGLQPGDTNELLRLAQFALEGRQLPWLALTLYRQALAQKSGLATGALNPHRTQAIVAAVQAAAGSGTDASSLDGTARRECRRDALRWLQADLQFWQEASASVAKETRQALENLLKAGPLTAVRDGAELAKLPEAERHDWEQLWQTVESLRKHLFERK